VLGGVFGAVGLAWLYFKGKLDKLDAVMVELGTLKAEVGTVKAEVGKVDAKLDKLLNRS
jgi:hypothetical protein